MSKFTTLALVIKISIEAQTTVAQLKEILARDYELDPASLTIEKEVSGDSRMIPLQDQDILDEHSTQLYLSKI